MRDRHPGRPGGRPAARATLAHALALAFLLAACGGGGGGGGTGAGSASQGGGAATASGGGGGAGAPGAGAGPAAPPALLGEADALRLAAQATMGANEELLAALRGTDAASWIAQQMTLQGSRYALGGSSAIDRQEGFVPFCNQAANAGPTCWRDQHSAVPLAWDFFRNALGQPDQLRQRVAFALSQIVVVSSAEVWGTYGHRRYQNRLLELAFDNYRQVLRHVALSPLMGEYLNNVNNPRQQPNENFARELLQLFSIGKCELEPDGRRRGQSCQPTYDNATVREYTLALTGWTYPSGGSHPAGCKPAGAACRWLDGEMQPWSGQHDSGARRLLAGVNLAAGHDAPAALEAVLDSLMAHPNMGPFIGRQIIQHLVSSNPSPAYVARVATAFESGRHSAAGRSFGAGRKGDLAATVAAVLLDPEARAEAQAAGAGRLREPALMFTGVLRALNGRTDGDALSWLWGQALGQQVFRAPSVFNFYPPDYPVAGQGGLVGPAFAIHGAPNALHRLNFLALVLDAGGAAPDPSVPGAVGTRVDLSAFEADAADAARLVDRLSRLAFGRTLPRDGREAVLKSVSFWTDSNLPQQWKQQRVRTAAYLVFASPQYQVQR